MIHVNELHSAASLDELRLVWRSLWGQTPERSFFQTQDWLELYLRFYGENEQLRVLTVSHGDQPIGIVPLVVRTVASRVGQLRLLTFPTREWATCGGMVGPQTSLCWHAVMGHIRQTRRDWDVIDIRPVQPKSLVSQQIAQAMRGNEFQAHFRSERSISVVILDSDWSDYWSRRSPRLRELCRAAEATLGAEGRVRFQRWNWRTATDTEPLASARLRQTVRALSPQAPRYQPNEVSTAHTADFLDALRERTVQSGLFDCCLLTLDERPLACAINLDVDGHLENVWFGSAHPYAIPVLLKRMLLDSVTHDECMFRIETPAAGWIDGWRSVEFETQRIRHFAPLVPKAQVLRLKQCLKELIGHDTRPKVTTSDQFHRFRPLALRYTRDSASDAQRLLLTRRGRRDSESDLNVVY